MKQPLYYLAVTAVKVLSVVARKSYQWCDYAGWLKFRHFDFESRPDDIYIVTYPRSGTTWVQMILYQLTTSGEMNFEHISEFIPFFERLRFGASRSSRTLSSPRIFKSHSAFGQGLPINPRGCCKYIYVARNGQDVAVSYFHFYRTHLAYQGTFEEFLQRFIRGNVQTGSWFKHVAGWWKHRNQSNVLFLRYEDLVTDLAGTVEKIASFCEIPLSNDRLITILGKCSFQFMKQHETKFDHLTEILWERGAERNAFIRKGEIETGAKYFKSEEVDLFKSLVARSPGTRWGRDDVHC
jgi:hypothetical protein